nr:uncharacterized protein LOC104099344 [Nicotiana tomentosiformis]
MMYKFIKATDKKVESQNSAIKNLEIQMSQLATLMSRQIKGDLPSNTEKNPKEHLKAISLWSDEYKDDQLITDSLERCLAKSGTTTDDDITIRKEAETLEKNSENEKVSPEEVQPKIERKTLPSHLKYIFLEPELFRVIISSSLTAEQEIKLIRVLREYKRGLGWTIADIKGISPAIYMHRFLMEDNYKPIVQPQRRLNPIM